ncbi:tetratricopeptide repeat protein [Desulfothermus sp.]
MDKQKPILLVDDIQPARETLSNILKVLGYKNFLDASNGEEAIELLKKNPDIQLIISDWKMPRMSGIELLKWVRSQKEFKNIPFIMVTSKGEKEDVALAAEQDVTEYLVKPVTVEALISKIEDIDYRLAKLRELKQKLEEIKKLIDSGKDEEIREELEKVLEEFPKDKSKLLREIAYMYMERGFLDEAEKMVNWALSENPLYTKGWWLKNEIALKKKDLNGVLSALEKLYELNPNSSKVLYHIGKIYLAKEKLDKAKSFFLMALKVDPKNEQLIQDIWNAYLENDLLDEVFRDFGHILFEKLNVETLNNLAVSLSKKGSVDQAIVAYRQALKKEPKNSRLHYNLAVAYLKTGKKKNALVHLNEAIQIDPEFENAKNLLEKLMKEKDLNKE